MRKRWFLIGCGGVSGGLLLLCVLGWLLGGSLQEHPPERKFEIEALLLSEAAFPSGWMESAQGPSQPASAPLGGQASIERIALTFSAPNGVAVHEIHRYRSSAAAAQEFERQLPLRFPEGQFWTPWMKPEGFAYQSAFATQFHVACAQKGDPPQTGKESCRLLGQYEEYVVRFSTHILPSLMTYEDFEELIRTIDERMKRHLGSDKGRIPTP